MRTITNQPKKYTIAVDWDATCVEGVWPDMGDWLPGAVEALHELDKIGEVVIWSCRVAPFEFHEPGRNVTWRDEIVTAQEIAAVKNMLDAVNLEHIEVWTRPYKPPALVYIDDKAVRFEGDWPATVEFVQDVALRTLRQTFGQNVMLDETDSDKPCCPGCPMCELGHDDFGVPPDDVVYGAPPSLPAGWCNGCYMAHPEVAAAVEAETFIGIDEYEFEQRVTDSETGGQKGRKLARFALIPWEFTRALARHFGIGALKYDDNNWRRGYDWDLSIDALERHFNAWKGGESVYTERFTGRDGKAYAVETHHLIAVAWQACVLYVFEKLGLGKDTRS